MLVRRMFSALRAPPEYFGMGKERFELSGKSLAHQDIRWARGCKVCQKRLTNGLVRLGMIHLALKGIDPTVPSNEFEICMAPISFLDEQQRVELFDIRAKGMDALNKLIYDVEGLKKSKWLKWLLWKFGGLSYKFLDQFIEEPSPASPPRSAGAPPELSRPGPGPEAELGPGAEEEEEFGPEEGEEPSLR